MGWTSMYRARGNSDREFFAAEFPSIEIVECATKGLTFYAAVRRRDLDDGAVHGLVVLLRRGGRDGESHNFSYKDMSETMGPVESRAPARVLDALTETDDEYALAWRQRCRMYLQERAARPKVRAGDTVRFAVPMNFSDGVTRDTFTYDGRGSKFRSGGIRVRVTNWRDREYEVVERA